MSLQVRYRKGNRSASKLISYIGEPWLLIYDNAEDTKLITEYWPKGKQGTILVTSRYHTFATSLGAGYGQELNALEPAAAVKMILSQCPAEAISSLSYEKSTFEALEIANRVGCLPLGIEASIGLIIEANCSLVDYNEDFKTAHAVLEEASPELSTRIFAPYPSALKDVYMDSLRNLIEDEQALLQVISLLDPDKIQEAMFKRSPSNSAIHQAGYMLRFRPCLKTLWRGRIAKNGTMEGNELPSFHVHRLLQACVHMEMDPARRQVAFESAICLISAVLGSKLDPSWPQIRLEFKEYFPHVQALHDFYRTYGISGPGAIQAPVSFLNVTRKAAW
jgi:hypothetical protein